ncbi:MAG: YbjN domain-containing protein [Myxococcales bacterium]|nr:YbjN domain-containing protein [Myxococcales bacterium]
MSSMFETVVEFFEADSWPVQLVKDDTALRTAFQGESGQWTCYARVRVEQEQFVFYSVCPLKVPENQLTRSAEFLHRANYGMIIGNFELDFSDGEVRYKTSIDVENDRLTVALCRQLVVANVMMMDRYLPGLMQVIYSDVTPVQAIANIEKH